MLRSILLPNSRVNSMKYAAVLRQDSSIAPAAQAAILLSDSDFDGHCGDIAVRCSLSCTATVFERAKNSVDRMRLRKRFRPTALSEARLRVSMMHRCKIATRWWRRWSRRRAMTRWSGCLRPALRSNLAIAIRFILHYEISLCNDWNW